MLPVPQLLLQDFHHVQYVLPLRSLLKGSVPNPALLAPRVHASALHKIFQDAHSQT